MADVPSNHDMQPVSKVHKAAKPYPVELNKSYGGIAIAVSSTSTGSNDFTVASLNNAVDLLFPIFEIGPPGTRNTNLYMSLKSVEMWGPLGGGVTLTPYIRAPIPFNLNLQSPFVSTMVREQFLSVGTATERPYLSYEWKGAESDTFTWQLDTGTDSQVLFNYGITFGPGEVAPPIGGQTWFYLHFIIKWRLPINPLGIYMEVQEEHGKKTMEQYKKYCEELDDTSERKRKIAKIRQLTLPTIDSAQTN